LDEEHALLAMLRPLASLLPVALAPVVPGIAWLVLDAHPALNAEVLTSTMVRTWLFMVSPPGRILDR
jgi:hypothetical protein